MNVLLFFPVACPGRRAHGNKLPSGDGQGNDSKSDERDVRRFSQHRLEMLCLLCALDCPRVGRIVRRLFECCLPETTSAPIPVLLCGNAGKQVEVSWIRRLPTVRCEKTRSFEVATGSSKLDGSGKANLLETLFQRIAELLRAFVKWVHKRGAASSNQARLITTLRCLHDFARQQIPELPHDALESRDIVLRNAVAALLKEA